MTFLALPVEVLIMLEGHPVCILEGREMPSGSLILVTSIIVPVALDELANLVTASPAQISALGFPMVPSTVESIGLILLAGLLVWRLLSLARQNS